MKQFLTIISFALASTSVGAQQVELSQLQACKKINNSLEKLSCYEKLTDDLSQSATETASATTAAETVKEADKLPAPTEAEIAAPAVAATSSSTAAPQAIKEDNFGLEEKRALEDVIDEISATVTNVKKNPHGLFILYLDNGQTWKQTSSKRFKVKVGDTLIITRGSFGSFRAQRQDSNRTINVKRLK
ncbi:hypothetical protein [Thalassotalea agarivorans]|uniref:Uncharacterized protein n=1 Tax=Thalassotalea agarivorans TaxID=349064 RepID=A0A1I0GN88_THASX|nr:hypothetical protein [Thalassotalea agarivorans]SET72486.1 hypothetical protein SAMN05660429_02520 [Thalassotalea agarivorans]